MSKALEALDNLIAGSIENWRSTLANILTVALVPLGSYAVIYHGKWSIGLSVVIASAKVWNGMIQKDK